MTSAIKSQGTAITVDISATPTAISEVSGISAVGQSSNLVDATHLSSTAREYIGGLEDGNEISIEGNYVHDDAGQIHLRSNIAETLAFVITLSNSDTVSFSAVLLEYGLAPLGVEDKVMFTARAKITGAVTYTDVSPAT